MYAIKTAMKNFESKMKMQKRVLRYANEFHNIYLALIQFAFSSIVVIVLASIWWLSCEIVLHSLITRMYQLMFHVFRRQPPLVLGPLLFLL